jgi:hypothetical protein
MINDNLFIAAGYKLLRCDRDSKGCGILAYINTDFPVSRKTILESETLENISVEVHINKNKWLVMGIYKPPSMSDNDFSTLFIKNIDQCIMLKPHPPMMGYNFS